MKRTIGLFFMMLLLIPAAAGFAAGSVIRDAISLLQNENPMSFELTAEIGKLPQFGEERTEMLNRILRHFSLSGILDEYESYVSLNADNEELFTLFQTEYAGKVENILSAGTGQPYLLPADPEVPGSSRDENSFMQNILQNRDLLSALDEYEAFFSSLLRLFPGRASETKINEQYRGYGTAVMKTVLTLTEEELNTLLPEHPELFPETSLIPFAKIAVFSGKQNFSFQYGKDGQLIKIQYSGKAGFSEGDIRNIRLDWKMLRSDNAEKDDLQLRTPDAKGTRRNNLLLERSGERDEKAAERFFWKAETDVVFDGVRTREISECSLASDDEEQMEGCFSRTATTGKESISDEAVLCLEGMSGYSFSGTLEIINKKDKIETERFRIRFRLSRDVPMQVTAPRTDPAALTVEEVSGVLKKLYADILRRILRFPESDLAFFIKGIREESWNEILLILNQ